MRGPLAVLASLALLPMLGAAPAFAGRVFDYAKWKHTTLRVCFGVGAHYPLTALQNELDGTERSGIHPHTFAPYTPAEKARIQAVIQREYTRARVGVEFAGWRDCSPTAWEADIVLLRSGAEGEFLRPYGVSNLGPALTEESGFTHRDPRKAAIYLRSAESLGEKSDSGFPWKMDRPKLFEWSAIHEFAHVLGVEHEHDRIGRGTPDENCRWTSSPAGYADALARESGGYPEHTSATSAYDPNSITNYCYGYALKWITSDAFVVDRALPEWKSTLAADDENGVDFPKKLADGRIPGPVMNLADPTLFRAEALSPTQTSYRVRIGLSLGDIHAIRCAQGYYSAVEKGLKCLEKFNPTQDPALLALPIPVDPAAMAGN